MRYSDSTPTPRFLSESETLFLPAGGDAIWRLLVGYIRLSWDTGNAQAWADKERGVRNMQV
jgi:hypothetical protein